jgi:hypothetical protein
MKKRAFERLNLEGGNVASDGIVEDDIVNGHILAVYRSTKAENRVCLKKRRFERLNLEGGNILASVLNR